MPLPILFDMDGIILEGPRTSPQVYADAVDDALAELDAIPSPAQRRELRRHDTTHLSEHCTTLGIDPDRFWALAERYASDGTHDRLRSGDRGRYDDTIVLDELAERTTLGLVTNNRHQTAEFVADHFEFEFDVIRGRDPTIDGYRRRKPNPYYIEDALATLGIDDDPRGLYVGDFEKDVIAGTAAGLETAFVRRQHNRELDRPADATYKLESLTELSTLLDELDR
ncbi:HAD family hydrolase [Natrialba asiatica]|uniref:Haloacid dehalogenase n=1 Tax=Natrialba asiatica (strain ATCC 700177 / DSM 12278 / JCM 9576 / FERM P-10747 / NBRC 102637 / 172P1) TaxID=29540 RepID=M0AK95_NATA1|nr:HAD-IA family hydrolase [Natrialba asiatica]ELY98786.1 haloacid dehalogenase [Natrialba asiatica DSM 12278]